jgi:hypothetical protein
MATLITGSATCGDEGIILACKGIPDNMNICVKSVK